MAMGPFRSSAVRQVTEALSWRAGRRTGAQRRASRANPMSIQCQPGSLRGARPLARLRPSILQCETCSHLLVHGHEQGCRYFEALAMIMITMPLMLRGPGSRAAVATAARIARGLRSRLFSV
eukprot:scaffold197683_cov31-Tisochrysis_lutea.AAC.5